MSQLVNKKVKMNLVGLDGNVFSLLGAFQKEAQRQDWTKDEIKTVVEACLHSDSYDNVLCILTDHTECLDDEEDEDYCFEDQDDEEDED